MKNGLYCHIFLHVEVKHELLLYSHIITVFEFHC